MKKTSILVVEDEVIIGQDIVFQLEDLGYVVVGFVHDFEEAVEVLNENPPDICLLDIEIEGDKDGIDLANYINKNHQIPFLYITSNADFTTISRAKETSPSGYIMKPLQKNDLLTSIEMAISTAPMKNELGGNEAASFFVQHKDELIKLEKKKVNWLKAEGNYTGIYLDNNRYLVRGNLKEILSKVGDGFMRVHKSYCVNIQKIDKISYNSLFIAESEVPIGKAYKEELMNHINKL